MDQKAEWKIEAKKLLVGFAKAKPAHLTINADVIRRGIENEIGSPDHHNSWGGLINWARKAGILIHTGRYSTSTLKSNNGHKNPVYLVDFAVLRKDFAAA